MSEKFQRDLLRGSLDLMVLSVLNRSANYGYLIQQEIRTATLGRVELQAGTLYPLLHRLESESLIRSHWDNSTGRKRKWYELTSAGRRSLRQHAEEWESFAECMSRVLVVDRPLSANLT